MNQEQWQMKKEKWVSISLPTVDMVRGGEIGADQRDDWDVAQPAFTDASICRPTRSSLLPKGFAEDKPSCI